MANTLPYNKQVVLHAFFKDLAGNPAGLTDISVSSSAPTILNVSPVNPASVAPVTAEDFLLVPVGPLGVATITVSGNNSALVNVSASIDIEVVADAATEITFTLDTPEAIPAPPVVAPAPAPEVAPVPETPAQ